MHTYVLYYGVGSVQALQKVHWFFYPVCIEPCASRSKSGELTSFCLEFCLEDAHGPSWGLMQ